MTPLVDCICGALVVVAIGSSNCACASETSPRPGGLLVYGADFVFAATEPQDWIKLAQRFPVWVIPELPEGYPLRIGVTASVAVYTREKYWLNGVTKAWHKLVATFDYLH